MKANSKAVAMELIQNPQIAEDLFRYVADSGQILGAARIASAYPGLNLTETIVRKVLHRRPPFEDSRIFAQVDPKDERAVTMRFKGRPQKRRYPDIEVVTKPVQQTLDIPDDAAFLHELIDAKLEIEKATKLKKCVSWQQSSTTTTVLPAGIHSAGKPLLCTASGAY